MSSGNIRDEQTDALGFDWVRVEVGLDSDESGHSTIRLEDCMEVRESNVMCNICELADNLRRTDLSAMLGATSP